MIWKRVTTGVPAGASRGPEPRHRQRVADREQRDEQPDVGVRLPGGKGTSAEHDATYDFRTVLEKTRSTMPYTIDARTMPGDEHAPEERLSPCFMCMYHARDEEELDRGHQAERDDDQVRVAGVRGTRSRPRRR